MPALSAVVYRSVARIPRSSKAPKISLDRPQVSAESGSRMHVSADVGGGASVPRRVAGDDDEPLARAGQGTLAPPAEGAEVARDIERAQIATRHLKVQAEVGVKFFEDLDVITQLLAEIPKERFAVTAGPIASMRRP